MRGLEHPVHGLVRSKEPGDPRENSRIRKIAREPLPTLIVLHPPFRIEAPRGQVFRAQPMGLCLEGRHPVLPCAAHSNGQGLPSTSLPLRLRSPASPPSEPPPPSFSQGPSCPRKRTSARRCWNSLRAERASRRRRLSRSMQ